MYSNTSASVEAIVGLGIAERSGVHATQPVGPNSGSYYGISLNAKLPTRHLCTAIARREPLRATQLDKPRRCSLDSPPVLRGFVSRIAHVWTLTPNGVTSGLG